MFRDLFLISVFLTSNIFANSQLQFEHFTIENGLSNNSVRTIIQDKKGFLWFATLNGLNRYDGKNIRVFTSEPGNLKSLSNNRVHSLVEDSYEYLWLFTFDDEIHRFDPGTEEFLNINRIIEKQFDKGAVGNTFVETSPGVMWIILTQGGLVRFIGSENPNEYKIDYFDTSSLLPGNIVNFIHKDKTGLIWLGTNRGLITLVSDTFDIGSLVCKRYFDKSNVSNFTTVCENGDILWFGTENNGLLFYYFPDNTLEKWDKGYIKDFPVTDIARGKNNDILVTTRDNGIFYLTENGKDTYHYQRGQTGSDGLKDDSYFEIYADNKGKFWLTSARRGITLFDPNDRKFTFYDLHSKWRESLGDAEKHIFFEDSNGEFWLGLYGGGICHFNRRTRQFEQYFYIPSNPNSISSNLVLSIFEDSSKNLWIGTFQGGLNKLELLHYDFRFIQPVQNASFKIENEVRRIIEDRYGRLWVGTKEGHVYCYNRQKDICFKIPEDLNNRGSYTMSSVHALLEDREGNLWIGTKGEGLYRINGLFKTSRLKNRSCKINHYLENQLAQGDEHTGISNNAVFDLFQDRSGQIWVGSYNGGLNLIENPADKIVFKYFRNDPANESTICDDRIRCFLQDSENNLWIGTSNGLSLLKYEYLHSADKKFINITRKPPDKYSLSNNDILCLHEDKQGNIWVATYGGGLNLLHKDSVTGKYRFEHYFKKHGLPSDVVFSILEDRNSNLWLGTDNGLCKFSSSGKQIEKFIDKEGLGDNFFSEGVCIVKTDGEFIFGQKSGFICFYPDSIKKDKRSYPIVLTGLNIFDEPVVPGSENSPLKTSIETTEEIKLKYNQNFLGIEFAVLDFKNPEKIQYAFILENFEEKWNYVINQNKAVYRVLRPGEYTFKVRGTNSDGLWMTEPAVLQITILPPVWETKAAFIIYLGLILFLIWLIRYIVLRQVKMKHEIILEKRLTEDKLTFFTNISHEFKTPLTLINGLTEDLLTNNDYPPDLRNDINLVKKNSTKLLMLIEQLLDFRRIQKGKMDLKTEPVELVTFFKDIYFTFLPMTEKKNIEFVFKSNFKKYTGWIDPKHIEKVIINLMSNAIKHTPEKKKIICDLHIFHDNKEIELKIIDQGEGISQENLAGIFDRFAFIKNDVYGKYSGSGIGLSLSRDLVKLHKGEITVESDVDKGSTFLVRLPVGEFAYSDEEKMISDHVPEITDVIVDIEDEIELSETDSSRKLTSSAVKSQILVIEDNDDMRNYLTEKLNKYFVVAVAGDGEKGLEIANRIMPDLIICDIMMPKIDGLEVTRQLKSNFTTSHIPVIILTAKSTTEQKIDGIETGADDYITKPFNMRYLLKRINNIINQRKKLKEKFSQDPGIKPEKLSSSSADQKFLANVISLVENNMRNPDFSIDDMVVELGHSRTVFYKKMKGITGYAPKEFTRLIRMKKAAVLLRETDITATQVSYEIGYNDPDYFSKSFKNFFGEPPSEYQKKFKKYTVN
jgi:signal transduction histidine kinase/ligand-binding sensor domain-containing protein/DNA-binding response OmpR family regulator